MLTATKDFDFGDGSFKKGETFATEAAILRASDERTSSPGLTESMVRALIAAGVFTAKRVRPEADRKVAKLGDPEE